jgi:acetyltransferase-like isoleucine patch superfamily enzyme
LLIKFWRYDLHPTSHIGFSWIFPDYLRMDAYATIGHLTVSRGLERLCLDEYAIVGRLNWIAGYPKSGLAYRHDSERRSELLVGRHAAITNRHLLDCTNAIYVGEFATVAGFRSQFLTHSIDLSVSRQDSKPIYIGKYSFTGTGCIVLGGSVLPDHCVLGAAALLNKQFTRPYTLYCGTPAKAVKSLPVDHQYFNRERGFVL